MLSVKDILSEDISSPESLMLLLKPEISIVFHYLTIWSDYHTEYWIHSILSNHLIIQRNKQGRAGSLITGIHYIGIQLLNLIKTVKQGLNSGVLTTKLIM